MGIFRTGPPEDLMLKLAKAEQVNAFVETGTCHGATAAWAARHFPKVFTIEFSRVLYDESCQTHAALTNVQFIFGDTRQALPEISRQVHGLVMYWLDAHWSGSVTYGEGDECPLMEELKIIQNSKKDALIFIDDARCFLAPPPSPHQPAQWPTIAEICVLLKQMSSNYIVVTEDVIISVPVRFRHIVEPYAQAKTEEFIRICKAGRPQTAGRYFKMAWKQLWKRC